MQTCGLIPVVPRPVQGVRGPLHRLRRLLQFSGAAHLGALAQGRVLGPQACPGLFQGGDPFLGRRPLLLGAGLLGLRFGEVPLKVLVAGVLAAGEAGAPAGGDPGVAPVVVQEGGGGPLGGGGGRQFLLLLVQGAEGLGHVGDDRLVHGRQGLGEGPGQRCLVGALGQLRLAQLDEQVDQGAVALLAESEECLVDGPAVGPGLVVHHAVSGDGLGEPVPGQGRAGGVEQAEGRRGLLDGVARAVVDALARERVPVAGDAPPADCLESAGQRSEMPLAAGPVESAELDPGVAEPLGVRMLAAEEQVPLHPLAGVSVGLDPA